MNFTRESRICWPETRSISSSRFCSVTSRTIVVVVGGVVSSYGPNVKLNHLSPSAWEQVASQLVRCWSANASSIDFMSFGRSLFGNVISNLRTEQFVGGTVPQRPIDEHDLARLRQSH